MPWSHVTHSGGADGSDDPAVVHRPRPAQRDDAAAEATTGHAGPVHAGGGGERGHCGVHHRGGDGEVVAEAALVDRSGGTPDLGVPFTPLIRIDVPTYEADAVPDDLAAIPAVKPGSRAAA